MVVQVGGSAVVMFPRSSLRGCLEAKASNSIQSNENFDML